LGLSLTNQPTNTTGVDLKTQTTNTNAIHKTLH